MSNQPIANDSYDTPQGVLVVCDVGLGANGEPATAYALDAAGNRRGPFQADPWPPSGWKYTGAVEFAPTRRS